MNEIQPLLVAAAVCGTSEEIVCVRVSFVKEGRCVVLYGRFLHHIETELAIHSFKLSMCFIHSSILLEFCPSVKGISGNLGRICLIRFWVRSE